MNGDGSGHRGDPDEPADEGGARSASRRRFLLGAGAAGLGLGIAGAASGPGGAGGSWTSTARNATRTPPVVDGTSPAAVRDESPRATDRSGTATGAPVIGANLNGRPRRLRDALELLDASGTTWVRAFLDVREKAGTGVDPDDDPDVIALRQVARERDCKLVVSLKWDFEANWRDKAPANVPRPGSTDDRALRRCAVRYLGAIGPAVEAVVLGNEPMWETPEADICVEAPPIVRFTRDVKDDLVRHGTHGDATYLVGAFNRIHRDALRTERFSHFYRGMLDLVRDDEDIDGVDLHLHYGAFAEAEAMVAVVREDLPDATITATEFSPVWRYARHVNTPIAAFDAGETFARDYDLPAAMTAVEYFEDAKRRPRSPVELAAFYDAMPWYNVRHVRDVHAMFAAYDVRLGTVGFLQDVGMRDEDWTAGWAPFHINFLFQPALLRTDGGLANTAHPHYLEDYRRSASGNPMRPP